MDCFNSFTNILYPCKNFSIPTLSLFFHDVIFIWTCLVSRLYLMQCGEGFVVNNLSNLLYKVTQLWPITARYSHTFRDKVITDVHMPFPSTISKYEPAIKMETIKNIKFDDHGSRLSLICLWVWHISNMQRPSEWQSVHAQWVIELIRVRLS